MKGEIEKKNDFLAQEKYEPIYRISEKNAMTLNKMVNHSQSRLSPAKAHISSTQVALQNTYKESLNRVCS